VVKKKSLNKRTTKRTSRLERLEQIREALASLRLTAMAAQLELELASGPQDADSRLKFFWRLLEPQLIAQQQRSVGYRIRQAKLPGRKTLDEFDFGFQKKLDRDRVMELATLDFVRRGQNLLVAGMSGTGKSHICIALGYLACAAGIRTLYTTSAEMLGALHASMATNTLAKTLKKYTAPSLLIIDEIGLDRPEREAMPDAQLFYKVVRPRHEQAQSTVITSNIPWERWGDYLGDDLASVAILDRLIEHGHVLTIDGPSYRAAEHSKLNARREPPVPTPANAGRSSRSRRTKPRPGRATRK
jgi:DNA replication protein DnaC